jgi:hypothetical protein
LRYKRVSTWSKGMLKLYSLIKNELVHITYSEYQGLDSTTTDALMLIASEYQKIQEKKIEDAS